MATLDLLYYVRQVQDKLNLPRTGGHQATPDFTGWNESDPVLPDFVLIEKVQQAVRWIIGDRAKDGAWAIDNEFIAVTAGETDYVLPKKVVAPLSVRYKWSSQWTPPMDIVHPSAFFDGFYETWTTSLPYYATVQQEHGRAVHKTGTITTANAANPPVLINTSANFATTISGEEIDTGDRVHNTTKKSLGAVDYLSAGTWKVSGSGGSSSGNTFTHSLITGAGVVVGDIFSFQSNNAWRVITAYNGTDTVTLSPITHREYIPLTTPSTYRIGTADRIVLQGGSFFVDDLYEGLLGGTDMDFDVNDAYQIEARVADLDVLKVRPAFSSSDAGTSRSLMIQFWGYPPTPTLPHHKVGLADFWEQAIVNKSVEFAIAHRDGLPMPAIQTLKDIASHRYVHNIRSGDTYRRHPYRQRGGRQTMSWRFN